MSVKSFAVFWPPSFRATLNGAALAVSLCLASGCVRSKPSTVASGEMYQPGEPTYDEFFKSLYAVQLMLGQAPGRQESARQGIAKAVDAPPAASPDDLSAALDKRLDALAKSGVSVKVSTSGLDGEDPTAKVVKSGTPSGADADTVTSLETSVHDAIALLVDLRHSKPELARLKEALPPLEPKVDTAFKDAPSRKRREVRSNLSDAGKLLPLMVAREEEVDGEVVELFHALEKASPPAVATPPPAAEAPPVKKKKEKKGAGEKPAKTKPDEGGESKPAPQAAAPAPKPAKAKPSEDFEP
ncbi:MAG TPA: hypothetical protein VHC69_35545 [Polyangiaceae bacterium]|nr:hypothetical protein [Polyangiaceae bacterium]